MLAPKGFNETGGDDDDASRQAVEQSNTGVVEDMYISPASAAPMQAKTVATLIAGVGIEGDRYATGKGTYSASFLSEPGRHVTIVSSDAVEEALQTSKMEVFEYRSQLRRNIIVGGIAAKALNDMVGHHVTLGATARLFVHRRNVPCKYREAQCQRPGLMNNLWEACGVCCEIVEGGKVKIGDTLQIVPDSHQPDKVDPGLKPPGFFLRPADRTTQMVKAAIISPPLAVILALMDPHGFQMVEEGYNSAGQHFWSPKAYQAGLVAMKVRTPVAIAVGVAVLSMVLGCAFNKKS